MEKEQKELELHLGHMTMRELSLWFGYSTPDGLTRASKKAKEKKMEILKAYADYHLENKKIIIDEIKFPIFSKAFKIIEEQFPKEFGYIVDDKTGEINKILRNQKIDTCARVGSSIWHKKEEVKKQVSLSTAKRYTNTVKVKQYGHNYLDDHGTRGESRFIRMNEDGTAPLQGEQLEIFRQCRREAYEGAGELIAEIDTAYRNGEISKEEKEKAQGMINTDSSYDRMVGLCIERLGFYPEQRT